MPELGNSLTVSLRGGNDVQNHSRPHGVKIRLWVVKDGISVDELVFTIIGDKLQELKEKTYLPDEFLRTLTVA